MKALLIAEKSSLMRTIQGVYKKNKEQIPIDITFMCQTGHLITLKSPDELSESMKSWEWSNIPFHPEDYAGFQYKVIQRERYKNFDTPNEIFEKIRKELESGQYDFVINAGDPDQEGELLIRIVLAELKNTLPIKRFWTNDLTEAKVLDALINLRDDDKDPQLVHLLDAAYGRQHSDYRFGMNISRAASLKMNIRVACGRVKTPILALVCKREYEIQNFKPSTCYGVKAIYEEGFEGQYFDELIPEEEEDDNSREEEIEAKDQVAKGLVWFDTKEEAEDFIKTLSPPANITKYESKKSTSYAPKLYKLSTLQIAAGKVGISGADTLATLQTLYEKGYISYPRTDCEYISSNENFKGLLNSASCVPDFMPYIRKMGDADIDRVKKTKKWVDDKKLEEAGHSALIPTTKRPVFNNLTTNEQTIYRLVCRAFVAIFMPPLIQNKITLVTEICGKTFRTTGKTLVSKGYTEIMGTNFTDVEIPMHKLNDVLEVSDFQLVERTSTCPKRYTELTLIAACEKPHKYLDDISLKSLGENLKIGTPATQTQIIGELINKDHYLQTQKIKKSEYIYPTSTGKYIYDNLKDCAICRVDMTGFWEEKLELVRTGHKALAELEQEMISDVNVMVDDIKNSDIKPKPKSIVIGKCPKCGSDLYSGANGYFCGRYREGCKVGAYKLICETPLEPEDFIRLMDNEIIEKLIKKGDQEWSQRLKYDFKKCKIEFVPEEGKATTLKCPKCNKLIKEDSRKLSCSCGFAVWKNICSVEISSEQIEKLITSGSTDLIQGFVSKKTGKKFDAFLVIKSDKSGTMFSFR